jgi:hypothetical protein
MKTLKTNRWNNFTRIKTIQAQVSVSLNIGTAPSWDHLVIPKNIIIYRMFKPTFDIRASQFIFFGNGRWLRSRYLPKTVQKL